MISAKSIVVRDEDEVIESAADDADDLPFEEIHGVFVVENYKEVTYEEALQIFEDEGQEVFFTTPGGCENHLFFTGNIVWLCGELEEASQIAGTVTMFDQPVVSGKLIIALRND